VTLRIQRSDYFWADLEKQNDVLLAERLIHGARDLPRRLRESPFQENE
jgi:hypothetical protein